MQLVCMPTDMMLRLKLIEIQARTTAKKWLAKPQPYVKKRLKQNEYLCMRRAVHEMPATCDGARCAQLSSISGYEGDWLHAESNAFLCETKQKKKQQPKTIFTCAASVWTNVEHIVHTDRQTQPHVRVSARTHMFASQLRKP